MELKKAAVIALNPLSVKIQHTWKRDIKEDVKMEGNLF